MPRDERIEKILAAWYEFKTAGDPHKAAALAVLNRLLDEHRSNTLLSRTDLLQALRPRFDEFFRVKLREENQFRKSAS